MVKPIILAGHTRPISQVQFNRDGDLLFSSSKDKICSVWFSETGERLGTYDGHTGAINGIDVNFDATRLLTVSGDSTTRLWDVKTGKELNRFNHDVPARSCNWATGDKMFLTVTAGVMKKTPEIQIFTLGDNDEMIPKLTIQNAKSQIVSAFWGPLNEKIFSAQEDGTVLVWDPNTGEELSKLQAHTKAINRFKFSNDKQYFATASRDNTCKFFDTQTLEVLKTFTSGRPIYDVAISPIMPHILLVGGQDVESVAKQHADAAQFRARVYHTVFETEIASISGHFAPINSITYSYDGKSFASGGEDGYVRLHHLDDSYFKGLSDQVLFPIDAPEF